MEPHWLLGSAGRARHVAPRGTPRKAGTGLVGSGSFLSSCAHLLSSLAKGQEEDMMLAMARLLLMALVVRTEVNRQPN